VRGREGGERRGRQGNQGLNLDANLNRYCPFPERWAHETTSSKLCCCAQTWGHHMCVFSLPSFLPFTFSTTSSLFFPPALPHVASVSLHGLQWLRRCLCLDLSPVHAPLSKSAGSLPSCLFVSGIVLPLTAASLLSSLTLPGNFSQQWAVFRVVKEAGEEQSKGDYCV